MLVILIVLLRITDITQYNTLFVDEALYATVGQGLLAQMETQAATTWMSGSYLYPAVAALVNPFGGVFALRTTSAILISLAALFIFFSTARLGGKQTALWATLIFGLTGASISLGQFAVLDILGVPFLALALYGLIASALSLRWKTEVYLLVAALGYSLAALSKYVACLYVFPLLLLGLLLYRSRRRSVRPLFTTFLLPSALILGLYVWHYQADLMTLLAGNYTYQAGGRWEIAQTMWEDLGVVGLMAIVGLWFAFRVSRVDARVPTRWTSLRSMLLILLLMVCFLSVPLYQLAAANVRSLWKHSVYSLIFLAPLAGYALATVSWRSRLHRGRFAMLGRMAGALITLVGLIGFANYALDHQWGLQHSWPDVSGAVTYLRSQGISRQSRVLASGSAVYEYYFGFGPASHHVWTSTWYMEYEGLKGTEAMAAATRDHYFQFVVLDNYYTPEVSEKLEKDLISAGYIKEYEQRQKLSFERPITIRIYTFIPPFLSIKERSRP